MGGTQSADCCNPGKLVLSPFEKLKMQAGYGQLLRESKQKIEDVTGRHHVEIVGEQDTYENWHEWDSLLDENPSHIDACDDEGNTLLHISILNHHQEAARRLIDGGADWKTKNKKGESAKELAVTIPKNSNTLSLILKLERERSTHTQDPPRAICHASPSFSTWTLTATQWTKLAEHDQVEEVETSESLQHLLQRMLQQLPSEAFQITALEALVRQVATSDADKVQLVSLGALPIIIQVMRTHNKPGPAKRTALIQAKACEVLTFLAFNDEYKTLIVHLQGHLAALEAMHAHMTHIDTHVRAMRLLYWLAMMPLNSNVVLEEGASATLHAVICRHAHHPQLVAAGLDVVQMLAHGGVGSDSLRSLRACRRLEDELFPTLVIQMMKDHVSEAEVQRAAASVVRHMSFSNVETRNNWRTHGTLECLATAMVRHSKKERVQEACCGALRNLMLDCVANRDLFVSLTQTDTHTQSHSLSISFANGIAGGGGGGGVMMMLDVLENHPMSPHVVGECLGALALMLAKSHSNKALFEAAGGMHRVARVAQMHPYDTSIKAETAVIYRRMQQRARDIIPIPFTA
eukprot:CAMPEP_0173110256 /NCGR_PEP_ID=MMETSP1102-20130122/44180_1 /TAXON_ID=49646 /ORGANISM="Geminigera sp., Strain Caron Lab Isolate" /LENGTH=575 /DNA_ID=CAMNT_0014009833 /DNA_START=22 /DNA_END=1748 /DNA_ORIENTATION=-